MTATPPKNDTPIKALVEAMEVLRRQLPNLDAAAMPTKCETYVVCGRYAREVHDAIKTVLAALSQPQHDGLVEAAQQMVAAWAGSDEDAMECAEANLRAALAGKPLTYGLSNSPVVGEDAPAIPAGMKPWHGGDSAPDDWDGGLVLWRGGSLECYGLRRDSLFWRSNAIIAYTPKPIPTDTADHISDAPKMVAADRREAIARPDGAIEALTNGQQQADMDGTFVKVSRQALDETLAYLASLIAGPPEGFVMVPVEPTEAMIMKGVAVCCAAHGVADASRVWSAMIAAATGEAS